MAGVKGRSGGPRANAGGRRPGAGRPRKDQRGGGHPKSGTPHPSRPPVSACRESFALFDFGNQRVGLDCVDCGAPVPRLAGAGRPRKRCEACNPSVAGLGLYKPGPTLSAKCAVTECQVEFTTTNRLRRYCSAKCRNRDCNREKQESRRDRSPRCCGGCGATFAPAYGDPQRRYCSQECRRKFIYRMNPGSTHRRRAKRYGRRYETINKWAVFERDGWKCQICGCDTPRELSGARQPDSPELDHVIPLAAGGDHVIGNVQCACRQCNLAKGARLTVGASHAARRIQAGRGTPEEGRQREAG